MRRPWPPHRPSLPANKEVTAEPPSTPLPGRVGTWSIGTPRAAPSSPAAPAATRVRTPFSPRRPHWATTDPRDAPIWIMGPSRPALPPEPRVREAATPFTNATRPRIRPPRMRRAWTTSGTPCPDASLARNQTRGPTTIPPIAGTRTTLRQLEDTRAADSKDVPSGAPEKPLKKGDEFPDRRGPQSRHHPYQGCQKKKAGRVSLTPQTADSSPGPSQIAGGGAFGLRCLRRCSAMGHPYARSSWFCRMGPSL